jgi:hypothetical protein
MALRGFSESSQLNGSSGRTSTAIRCETITLEIAQPKVGWLFIEGHSPLFPLLKGPQSRNIEYDALTMRSSEAP